MQDGKMIASVCGVVERVNKLISVRSLKSRYVPKIGDVVVARVVDVEVFSDFNCVVRFIGMGYGHCFPSVCHSKY